MNPAGTEEKHVKTGAAEPAAHSVRVQPEPVIAAPLAFTVTPLGTVNAGEAPEVICVNVVGYVPFDARYTCDPALAASSDAAQAASPPALTVRCHRQASAATT